MLNLRTLSSALLICCSLFYIAGADPGAYAESAPQAPRILIIGDSHGVGPFGRMLVRELRNGLSGANVWAYAASSATPSYYFDGTRSHGGFSQDPPGWAAIAETGDLHSRISEAKTPTIEALLAESQATVVVVELGSNFLRGPLSAAAPQIAQLVKAIRADSRPCIWVGPPKMHYFSVEKQAELFEILKRETQGCLLIDSRPMTHYPELGGDGIHFNGGLVKIGREWGKQVAAEVVRAIRSTTGEGG